MPKDPPFRDIAHRLMETSSRQLAIGPLKAYHNIRHHPPCCTLRLGRRIVISRCNTPHTGGTENRLIFSEKNCRLVYFGFPSRSLLYGRWHCKPLHFKFCFFAPSLPVVMISIVLNGITKNQNKEDYLNTFLPRVQVIKLEE